MMSHSNYLFILPLSSFPFISCMAFFNVILGIFFCFKMDFFFFFFSFLSSLLSALAWWKFYSMELSENSTFSFNLMEGLKFSFVLFILSEVFFFFSFFWSYFHFFLGPFMEFNYSWPPYSVLMFDFLEIPFLNTLLLLSSGLSVTVSHFYFYKGKIFFFMVYLVLTFLLGIIFSYFQYIEYNNSFFCYSDGCFGSCFFTLTGFHGMHVLIGSAFLIFVFFRFFSSFSSLNYSPLSFDLSSWYWHFVDVVWIFLYFFVYVYACV